MLTMKFLKAWEANVKVHKRGLELIKPGVMFRHMQ